MPLAGVRVLDFTWLNAGAKGARHLSLYGAELIHLEWKARLDVLRSNPPFHTVPGEAEVAGAAGAGGYESLNVTSVNRAASFNNNHVGKWGASLNMHHPKGKALFTQLVQTADIIVENYTAKTLEGWGFGWQDLEKIRPDIIYIQSPGFGRQGPYVNYRTYGPTAAAISGLTSQSGLPDRYPVGYGFSFMDVCAPYFIAMAAMAALRQRQSTGRGVYVDLSQSGPSFLLTGTSIPDWSANDRSYQRTGNRSPYITSAPHGAYRCIGIESWLAIACFGEEDWQSLVNVMGNPSWASEPQFSTLEQRYQHQDELDPLIEQWTSSQDRYTAMQKLQDSGVTAAVCQDSKDRYEIDSQLKHRQYFVEVPHSEVPAYDVEGHPSRFSETQPSPYGQSNWGTAIYGEHNARVFGELLGLTNTELVNLAEEDVI